VTTTFYATMPSPVGQLLLTASADGLTGVYLPGEDRHAEPAWALDRERLAPCIEQLNEYFAGHRDTFSVPLAPPGTSFQRQVWSELGSIPFATTITYTELARRVGRPRSVRAAGGANGRNPCASSSPATGSWG